MSKKSKKEKLGIAVICIGVGIVVSIIIPCWGWMLALGGGLIYCGWYLMEHS
ncbi:hypothetical protein CLOACE_00260 [Clostridium acetireducens DSM 10703]|jgi:4-hydroxybenzoate polyprenyltransferase|uniref:Uncharacterized protein n=1 Tax=Clostridium acetireducens DSM 10703 TaxID=1121290 RepID=A0A1E8F2U6_9CLOT|nr:hypothetical protein [Clostridium acetireducens]OFI07678.1 hypothetical protein CLOACE_00260 [Clostridium acetireducens DSM 10703]